MPVDDDRFRDLCIGYLSDELSADERRAFLEELDRRGAEGREELRSLREAYGAVSLDAPAAEPPDGLKESVMEAVDADAGDSGGGTPGRATPSAEDGGGGRWVRWGLAAAAVLLLGLLGLNNLRLRGSLERTRAALDSAERRLARADSLQRRLAALEQDFTTVAAPSTESRLLSATRDTFPGRARVFVDPETGRALLYARDLPILPPDSVYQLWTIRDGEPESAGTFQPGADRQAQLEIPTAEQVLGADAVAVTVEPAPGSRQPSTQPILVASSS